MGGHQKHLGIILARTLSWGDSTQWAINRLSAPRLPYPVPRKWSSHHNLEGYVNIFMMVPALMMSIMDDNFVNVYNDFKEREYV